MPLANIYDPLLMHSVAIQLRIAKCLAIEVDSQTGDVNSCIQQLLQIDRLLQESLQIYQKLAMEVPTIKTEILFIKGKEELFVIRSSKCFNQFLAQMLFSQVLSQNQASHVCFILSCEFQQFLVLDSYCCS